MSHRNQLCTAGEKPRRVEVYSAYVVKLGQTVSSRLVCTGGVGTGIGGATRNVLNLQGCVSFLTVAQGKPPTLGHQKLCRMQQGHAGQLAHSVSGKECEVKRVCKEVLHMHNGYKTDTKAIV